MAGALWRDRIALIARRLSAVCCVLLALCHAPAHSANIAVDIESGTVLTESDADVPRLPASLAKLMMGFVAFEALAAGEISEDASVTVSGFAAARPPVKLGLRKGRDVEFGAVLGAALVGSKNDAAVVVAEAVAGSEAAFVERMNAAARQLGMVNTRFANATGLPAEGQQTSARDIAILAQALLTQYPNRSALFSKRSVRALGRSVSTTNPLFGRVKGAEGLKTGFTCAAGYSIAALVERNGRRIVAVTLGHRSKGARLSAVRGVIEAAFKLPPDGEPLAPGSPSDQGPPDVGTCVGAPATLVATDISPEEKALYQAELEKARQRAALAPAPQAERITPRRAPPLFGWAVFLGAYGSDAEAKGRLRNVILRGDAVGTPRVESRQRDGRRLALFYGMDQRTASKVCRADQGYCLVIKPAALLNPRARWRK